MKSKYVFIEWMRAFGINPLSRALKVHRTTVNNWRNRTFRPSSEILPELLRLGEGKITYADMLEYPLKRK